LIQGSLDGLNLQHTVCDDFTFESGQGHLTFGAAVRLHMANVGVFCRLFLLIRHMDQ
jgi:hypothetical protein